MPLTAPLRVSAAIRILLASILKIIEVACAGIVASTSAIRTGRMGMRVANSREVATKIERQNENKRSHSRKERSVIILDRPAKPHKRKYRTQKSERHLKARDLPNICEAEIVTPATGSFSSGVEATELAVRTPDLRASNEKCIRFPSTRLQQPCSP
jgi:hypothetical protein